jgi:hypothetical protein
MRKIFRNIPYPLESIKQEHYLRLYEEKFTRFVNKPIKLLEIGVNQGGSLWMWGQYFKKAKIYAIDIKPAAKSHHNHCEKIFIGDQGDKKFLESVIEEIGRPDIIIDSGGHTMGQQTTSFLALFPYVKDGGYYVIEKVDSSYITRYGGALYGKTTIEMVKALIEDLHWQTHKATGKDLFTRCLNGMEIYENIIFFQKTNKYKLKNNIKSSGFIDLVIFSKNRPMQLECTIRSIRENAPFFNINVIYLCAPEYQDGYNKIQKVNMVEQNLLKEDVLNLLRTPLVCFMVDDDIIFKKPGGIPELKKNETFSLRMGVNVKKHRHYPLALDGHIFRIQDIKPLIEKLDFDNPNVLEKKLHHNFGKGSDWKILFDRQCLVGVPHNRVSSKSHCEFTGKYPTEVLNKMFMEGQVIDYDSMDFSNITDVHKDIDYKFKQA